MKRFNKARINIFKIKSNFLLNSILESRNFWEFIRDIKKGIFWNHKQSHENLKLIFLSFFTLNSQECRYKVELLKTKIEKKIIKNFYLLNILNNKDFSKCLECVKQNELWIKWFIIFILHWFTCSKSDFLLVVVNPRKKYIVRFNKAWLISINIIFILIKYKRFNFIRVKPYSNLLCRKELE